MKRILLSWVPALIWMSAIFAFSASPSLPEAPGRVLDVVVKKTAHVLEYGLLACLYLRGLRRFSRNGEILRLIAVGLCLAYALSDEYHQSFVPGRNGRLLDVAVDGVGACGAMVLDWWRDRSRSVRTLERMPGP